MAKVKIRQNKKNNFIFIFLLKGQFFPKGGAIAPKALIQLCHWGRIYIHIIYIYIYTYAYTYEILFSIKKYKILKRLKNIFHKTRETRAIEDWDNCKKQRNFSVNLLRNTIKDYFQKLNIKDFINNEKILGNNHSFF